MGVQAVTVYQATCDWYGNKLQNSDDETLIANTPEGILNDALHHGWVTYQGELVCNECVVRIAEKPHDFVTNTCSEPFCAICKNVPDAGHTNVPVAGQLEIPKGQP